mmetsp:Transcript_15790/g.31825  ORF Transcript_15790/g.31825 Transcript_15790/m.31825 type:complete len:203 (-) Transcript_15790:2300-2908(-)
MPWYKIILRIIIFGSGHQCLEWPKQSEDLMSLRGTWRAAWNLEILFASVVSLRRLLLPTKMIWRMTIHSKLRTVGSLNLRLDKRYGRKITIVSYHLLKVHTILPIYRRCRQNPFTCWRGSITLEGTWNRQINFMKRRVSMLLSLVQRDLGWHRRLFGTKLTTKLRPIFACCLGHALTRRMHLRLWVSWKSGVEKTEGKRLFI